MNDLAKNLILWMIVVGFMLAVFNNFGVDPHANQQKTYSEFLQLVKKGEVADVTVHEKTIRGKTKNGQNFVTYMPFQDQFLLSDLLKRNVEVKGTAPERQSLLLHIFIRWFPMLLRIGRWIGFRMRWG